MSDYGAVEANRIKHMEMIQAAIARHGSNWFVVKGWAITVTTALVGIAEQEDPRTGRRQCPSVRNGRTKRHTQQGGPKTVHRNRTEPVNVAWQSGGFCHLQAESQILSGTWRVL